MRQIPLLLVAALLVVACGTKGPLTLPPPTSTQPAAAKADHSKTPPAANAALSSPNSQK